MLPDQCVMSQPAIDLLSSGHVCLCEVSKTCYIIAFAHLNGSRDIPHEPDEVIVTWTHIYGCLDRACYKLQIVIPCTQGYGTCKKPPVYYGIVRIPRTCDTVLDSTVFQVDYDVVSAAI
ncbi:hypothetical protein BLA27_10410 [Brucella cytisi]|uniref:Uncharacterized protein n=1 Tax=Brucella cytisi TaxID=407152 RepID=A0A1J6I487_9HYPH|nr:hypothetical protein BLA27_10410 [Brucella cytisi]